jgi:BlaI family transcriptional regulator, penicillinase repressor
MTEKRDEGLSRRERQIMDVIYERGAATAVEVLHGLSDPPSKTAVRTLLRILEEKGHLKHLQQGKRYVYQPTRPRLRAGRSALQRVLKTFFDGSLERAVAAHLGDSGAKLSPAELQRLADLIQQARSKGK